MSSLQEFLSLHEAQLESNKVPKIYWASLCEKLTHEIFDAGERFQLQQTVTDDDSVDWQVTVCHESGIDPTEQSNIFLVDHAWTFRPNTARAQLTQLPALAERMAAVLDIDPDIEQREDAILERLYKFANTYSLGFVDKGDEASQPVWYMLDEFGARIQHSDRPNCRLVPFLLLPHQMPFSLLWVTEALQVGDELCRDYAEGALTDTERVLQLLPWQPKDLTSVDYRLTEPPQEFYVNCRIGETLPDPQKLPPPIPTERKLRVYTQFSFVQEHLGSERIEVVDSIQDADVACLSGDFKEFKEFEEEFAHTYIMQFPAEYLLTCKDLLAVLALRARRSEELGLEEEEAQQLLTAEYNPPWWPITFNLDLQADKFVSFFQRRQRLGLSNYWILKPSSLSRSLDTSVSSNLDYLIRAKGKKKIVSLYVSDPALAYLKEKQAWYKFDFRYIVAVKSFCPLKLAVWKMFCVRYAARPYSLDQLDDTDTHITFTPQGQLWNTGDEFVELWDAQHKDYPWAKVERSVFDCLLEMFTLAAARPPPAGVPPAPRSRAIYGIDMMVRWVKDERGHVSKVQPIILECNFHPDNKKYVQMYPQFFNELYSALFFPDFRSEMIVNLESS